MLNYNDPGHVCPQTQRQCITVETYDKLLWDCGDTWAYQYSPSAEEMGLDPWRLIEGLDKYLIDRERPWVLCFSSGHEVAVPGEYTVYV